MALDSGRLAIELFGEAPVGQVWHRQLSRCHGADPVRRTQPIGGLTLGASLGDELARIDRGSVRHEDTQLVVLEVHHFIRPLQGSAFDKLRADRHDDEAKVSIGALVDVEVMVGRKWRHQQVDVVQAPHLFEAFA